MLTKGTTWAARTPSRRCSSSRLSYQRRRSCGDVEASAAGSAAPTEPVDGEAVDGRDPRWVSAEPGEAERVRDKAAVSASGYRKGRGCNPSRRRCRSRRTAARGMTDRAGGPDSERRGGPSTRIDRFDRERHDIRSDARTPSRTPLRPLRHDTPAPDRRIQSPASVRGGAEIGASRAIGTTRRPDGPARPRDARHAGSESYLPLRRCPETRFIGVAAAPGPRSARVPLRLAPADLLERTAPP